MKKIIMVENQEFNSSVKIGAHHYAELFANNGYEVLWISPAFSAFHYLGNNKLVEQRRYLYKNKKTELAKNIFGYAPFTLLPFVKQRPFNSSFIGKNYLYTSIPNIKKELQEIGFGDVDILWISNLKSYYIKNFIKYKKLVHRLADEKRGFKNFYNTLSEFEDDLIRESDIVFATAKKLVERVNEIRNDVIYLPNGVRYDDFQRENYKIPSEYLEFKDYKKCIYIGAIAEWVDKELVESCLKKLPNVHFYFIGPDHGGLNGLETYENLHIIGKKPYNVLPNYLHYSDAAIIPFKVNKLTNAINPVKLYEYLASGVPTVTTNLVELEYVDGPFEIAYNKDEFIGKIKNVLVKQKDENMLKKYAMNNSWEQRFKTLIKYCD